MTGDHVKRFLNRHVGEITDVRCAHRHGYATTYQRAVGLPRLQKMKELLDRIAKLMLVGLIQRAHPIRSHPFEFLQPHLFSHPIKTL